MLSSIVPWATRLFTTADAKVDRFDSSGGAAQALPRWVQTG